LIERNYATQQNIPIHKINTLSYLIGFSSFVSTKSGKDCNLPYHVIAQNGTDFWTFQLRIK